MILKESLPFSSIGFIRQWFEASGVRFRLTRTRSSKLGDYRPPGKGLPARISVNSELNPYEFLITLVHEMAHHEVWKEWNNVLFFRKRKSPPHGSLWKNHYQDLMRPLLNPSVFPHDVLVLLEEYFRDPRASSKTDLELVRVLKKYDRPDGHEFLESLPAGMVFILPDGRRFRKQEKLRKRYRCLNLENNRVYLFHPLVKVHGV